MKIYKTKFWIDFKIQVRSFYIPQNTFFNFSGIFTTIFVPNADSIFHLRDVTQETRHNY